MRRAARAIFAGLSIIMIGVGSYAAAGRAEGLAEAATGQVHAALTLNLSISAVATSVASAPLYPGSFGDVTVSIANPNPYPVTITAIQLPSSTTYATGYTSSTLDAPRTGCLADTPSDVSWSFATSTYASSHTLTTPITVGASGALNNPFVVTLRGAAHMGPSAPLACAGTYFSMPPLAGVIASGGSAMSTSTPAIDEWTS
jgi:hypothetical protein